MESALQSYRWVLPNPGVYIRHVHRQLQLAQAPPWRTAFAYPEEEAWVAKPHPNL